MESVLRGVTEKIRCPKNRAGSDPSWRGIERQRPCGSRKKSGASRCVRAVLRCGCLGGLSWDLGPPVLKAFSGGPEQAQWAAPSKSRAKNAAKNGPQRIMGAQAWLCSGGRGAQVPFRDAGGAADAEPRRYPRRRGAKTWGAKAGPRRGPKGPRTRGLNFSGGRTDPAFRFPGTGDRKLASGRRWNFFCGDSPTRWISPYGSQIGGSLPEGHY